MLDWIIETPGRIRLIIGLLILGLVTIGLLGAAFITKSDEMEQTWKEISPKIKGNIKGISEELDNLSQSLGFEDKFDLIGDVGVRIFSSISKAVVTLTASVEVLIENFKRVIDLFKDDDLRAEMGKKAKEVAQNYKLSVVAKAWVDLYKFTMSDLYPLRYYKEDRKERVKLLKEYVHKLPTVNF